MTAVLGKFYWTFHLDIPEMPFQPCPRSCRCCLECSSETKPGLQQKKPRSNTFRSGEFGGWHVRRMSHPSAWAACTNAGSLTSIWVLALSCWMNIGNPLSSAGHFSLIAGSTFSIRNCRIVSFFTDIMAFVTKVPTDVPVCVYGSRKNKTSTSRKKTKLPNQCSCMCIR